MNVFAETNASRSASIYRRLCSTPMLQPVVYMESVTAQEAALIRFKLSVLPAVDSAEVILALRRRCRRRSDRLHSRLANFLRPNR
jgi:hypothetical protein